MKSKNDINNNFERKSFFQVGLFNPVSLSLSQVPFWLDTYRHNFIASVLLSSSMFCISFLTISKSKYIYNYLDRNLKRKYFGIVGFLILILFTICLYLLFNSGLLGPGSDGDDQYFVIVKNVLSGLPLYHGETYHGNPMTPFPGLFVLVFPFALLGSPLYSLLNIFTIQLVFYSISEKYNLRNFITFLIFSLLCFPLLLQQLGSGHDYLYNYYILILSGSYILFNYLKFLVKKEDSSASFVCLIASSLIFGLAISGRPILSLSTFVGLLSTVLLISKKQNLLIRRVNISRVIFNIAFCLTIATLISLWGFMQDPSGFDPLHFASASRRSLRIMNEISIYIPYLLIIISVFIPIIISKLISSERFLIYINFLNSKISIMNLYNYFLPAYIWTLFLFKKFFSYNLFILILSILISVIFYFYTSLAILNFHLKTTSNKSFNVNYPSIIIISSLFSSFTLGIVFSSGLFIHWIYIYVLIPIYLVGFYFLNGSKREKQEI